MAHLSTNNVCLSMVMTAAVVQLIVMQNAVHANVLVINNSTTSISVQDKNTSLALDPLNSGVRTTFPISDAGEHTFAIDKYAADGTGKRSPFAVLQVFPNATLLVFDGCTPSVETTNVPLGVLVEYLT